VRGKEDILPGWRVTEKLDGREKRPSLFPQTENNNLFPITRRTIKSKIESLCTIYFLWFVKILYKTTMMRVMPAAKVLAFARASPANRNVAFTALRMMSAAAPGPKVCVERRQILCNGSFYSSRRGILYSFC
jgi:hypothetical protein